jgi:hypothetical protein
MAQDGTPNQPTIPAFLVNLADRTVLMSKDGKPASLNPESMSNALTLGEAGGGSTIRGLAIYGCPAGAGIAVLPHLQNLAEADVLIANPRAAIASGSLAQADLADANNPASGDWPYDNPIPGGGGSYYAFRATGTISVPATADYTFALGSDDGSRLRIDGAEVVAFPLPRSFADSFGTLHLAAGQHSVEWVGFQGLVAAGFELSVAPAGAPLAVSAANGWNVLGDPNPLSGITLVGPLAVTVHYEGLVDDPLDNTLIEGTVITGNQGPGIDNEGGRVTVNNSTLSTNSSPGIVNSTPNSFYVNSGTLMVQNSTLSGNSAQSGGGIFNDFNGTLAVQNSTIGGNSAQSGGGGIENNGGLSIVIVNSTFSGNTALNGDGGALDSFSGSVNLVNSTIISNSASSLGGGLLSGGTLTVQSSTIGGNSAQYGGGSFNFGSLTMQNSTLSGNSAQYGGGTYNEGNLTIANSTLSGNTALNGYGGAVLSFSSYPPVNLISSTISSNTALNGYGGGFYGGIGSLANSIIAGNGAVPAYPDINGFIVSSDGHNLIGNADGASGYVAGDQVGNTASPLDPKLGPLQNNGGPTFTHALLPGSPAIDAGATGDALDPSGAPLTTDQRGAGFPRVLGAAVDIGAFEYGTPQQRITHLINEVNSLPIQAGLQKTLVAILNSALLNLGGGRTQLACGLMTSFVVLVKAQAGYALTSSVAAGLAAEAQAIQFLLGCSPKLSPSITGS